MSANTPPPTAAPSPIADLSYRNYDGPLHSRALRWWPIALNGLRLAVKEKGFWFLIILCVMPYLYRGFHLYITSRAPQGLMSIFGKDEPGQKFAGQFYAAFTFQQLIFLFTIALTVGPKSISADNQANALLVYLSKPISKGDYLLGKWMSIFLSVWAVAFLPALALYLFCLLSFSGSGFLRDEPMLLFRIIAVTFVPGALHASLLVACSAWSKTPNIASSVYAGFYFIAMIVGNNIRDHQPLVSGQAGLLSHLSIDGLGEGLAQNIFGVTLHPFNLGQGMAFGQEPLAITPPAFLPLMLITASLCILGVMAARARIRAVEVIKG